jgi:hypothetical protein
MKQAALKTIPQWPIYEHAQKIFRRAMNVIGAERTGVACFL